MCSKILPSRGAPAVIYSAKISFPGKKSSLTPSCIDMARAGVRMAPATAFLHRHQCCWGTQSVTHSPGTGSGVACPPQFSQQKKQRWN